jgi:branched-subunit amino acid ABC-type transport system permease component
LVFDSTRVFHVAFAAVYTLPPFVWWATLRAGWPWAAGAALAILAGVAVALLCETVNHSRLERIKASEDLHFVDTLGTYIFIVQAIVIAWGNEAKFIHSGAHPTKQLLGVLLPRSQIISSVILPRPDGRPDRLLYGTRFGLKLRAHGGKFRSGRLAGTQCPPAAGGGLRPERPVGAAASR